MEIILFVLLILCAFFLIFLLIHLFLLKRDLKEITKQIKEKLTSDTNTPISISSNDKSLQKFVLEINKELYLLRKETLNFKNKNDKLKVATTNIAHDLRTPLTAICGYLDLLEKEEDIEKIKKYFAIIRKRTDSMCQLTEEFFKYSLIFSTTDDLKKDEVILNNILEESIAGFYASLKLKNIVPNIEISENKIKRRLNPLALKRIFDNILNNAVKYSSKDLSISLKENGEIIFKNYAENINLIEVETLFDRFYTVESSTKSSGLGLSIAKYLTEKMGGEIRADYKNNELIIKVYFPEL